MKYWVLKSLGIIAFFSLIFSYLTPVQAAWWSSVEKKEPQRVLRLELESYAGFLNVHTSEETIKITLVYEFGVESGTDRVWIDAPNYPEFNGREVFKGQIRSVALDEGDWRQTQKDLKEEMAADILERVEFFPSHLSKTSYKPKGSREYVNLLTQSFFADDAKTYIFDLDTKKGLTFLELGKVYTQPAEMVVKYSEILIPSDSAHPRYHRLHFAVLVKEEADLNQNEQRKRAISFYLPFEEHLEKLHLKNLLQAFRELVSNLKATRIEQKDVRNLMNIDSYLASLRSKDSNIKILPLPSQASSIEAALDIRMLVFGSQQQDVWIFQFDPLMQQTEKDFTQFYPQKEWRGRSNHPDAQAAFVHTDRGVIVTQSLLRDIQINENAEDKNQLRLTLVFPDMGTAYAEFAELRIPVGLNHFERQIHIETKKSLQGNSDYYKHMLDDVITYRPSRACLELFSFK